MNEWKVKRLDEICSLRKDPVAATSLGADRYIALEHIDSGRSSLTRWDTALDVRSTKARFRTGDILYGKLRPYLDKAVVAPFDGVCSTELLPLEPIGGEVTPHFLTFLLHSPAFLAHADKTTAGVNHPRTSWSAIAPFEAPIPPPEEQAAIASALKVVEKAIRTQQQLEDVLRQLKKTTMETLFHAGLRGEERKDSDIGPIPDSWDVIRLGSCCDMRSGGTPSRGVAEYWNGDIPWVKTTEVNYREIIKTEEHISRKGLLESAAKLFPAGTLLMAMYGQGVTRGRVALMGIDGATNQACAAFFPDETISSRFLYAYFSYAYDHIRQYSHGANQQNLSLDLIKQMWIPRPRDKGEQEDVFKVVDSLQRLIDISEKRSLSLQTLFRATLAELMSARPRIEHQYFWELTNA